MKLIRFIYVLMVIIAAGLSSCSEEIIIKEEQLDEDLLYVEDKLSLYTGKCRVVYSDTDLTKEILSFRKGKLQGDAVYFYKNGKLKWKGTYKNGFISGTWEYWNENGEKLYEVNYHNDTLEGVFKSWYPNGLLKEQGSYENNRKKGEWIVYNESGSIIETLKY
ncbi:MAG: toxin-antitoxin system YwqK family antitoxin [Bacteroidales bacterium]|nr:toxin-antitoxin system YwqK family antitoxin [Bacteroidales bacterium]